MLCSHIIQVINRAFEYLHIIPVKNSTLSLTAVKNRYDTIKTN